MSLGNLQRLKSHLEQAHPTCKIVEWATITTRLTLVQHRFEGCIDITMSVPQKLGVGIIGAGVSVLAQSLNASNY